MGSGWRWAAVAMAAFLSAAPAARAQYRQNDQVFVAGFTLAGFHRYAEKDEVRRETSDYPETTAAMGQAFVELYAGHRFGVGARWLFLDSGYTLVGGPYDNGQELSVSATLLTFHFLPYISRQGDYRIGCLAGIGKARYTHKDFTRNLYDPDAYSTSGTATLAQLYLDGGADLFGARIGVGYLGTTLDKLRMDGAERQADATGTHVFVDLRWAFPGRYP